VSVDGTGTARTRIHLSADANGGFHLAVNQNVSGTAADSAGGTYRFNYHNAIAASLTDFPFETVMTDHFNLVGPGGNTIRTFFAWRVLITGPDEDDIEFLFPTHPAVLHGDPELCDPI
jgi:hypothetical protein